MTRAEAIEHALKHSPYTSEKELGALYDLVADVKPTWALEMGSMYGATAFIICAAGAHSLGCVDMFYPRPPDCGPMAVKDTYMPKGPNCVARFMEVTKMFSDKINLHIMKTTEVARFRSVYDFVFIDADHTYDAVINDIFAATRALYPDGVMCGHDYGCPGWPGVKEAVDASFSEKVEILEGTTIWVKK